MSTTAGLRKIKALFGTQLVRDKKYHGHLWQPTRKARTMSNCWLAMGTASGPVIKPWQSLALNSKNKDCTNFWLAMGIANGPWDGHATHIHHESQATPCRVSTTVGQGVLITSAVLIGNTLYND